MKMHDIVFIGAGASALMAAAHLLGKDVALIDSNAKIGAKILISGGGKCNLTNRHATEHNYLGDEIFIKTVFSKWSPKETIAFAKAYDVKLEEREHGQLFCARSAKELTEVFAHINRKHTFYLNTKVLHVRKTDEHFSIETSNGTIGAKRLVVASGGLSYASIGASDTGYEIAKSFGHSIVSLSPALVGLTLQKEQFWMKELSGIALNVSLHVEGKVFNENLLFAHKGISGPAVLSGSLYWKKGALSIDFLPHIDSLEMLFKTQGKKQISTALTLPKRFTKAFLEASGMEDKVLSKLNTLEKETLLSLKKYTFSPAGNFGYTKAEATKGGVCTDEIEPQTMQSKCCKGLYFIGEVLDVTGELGGFNFQWAFASGVCASRAL